MAEILLFHHAGGLSPGVTAFATQLRNAGHVVHAPDLFEGRTFDDVADGVAYAQSIGDDAMSARAAAAAADLPVDIVVAGMSLGCVFAMQTLLARPAARGALFLYGVALPGWWDAPWPVGVPAQAHLVAHDPWREPEAEVEFVAIAGTELFVYEDGGHCFLDVDRPDYDAGSAAIALGRLLAFLDRVS